MCPCRPLASGHGTLATPPEENCPRRLSTGSLSLGMLALRFSQAILVAHLAFYIETTGRDLPSSQRARTQGRLRLGLGAFLAAWQRKSLVAGCWHPNRRDGGQGALWPLAQARWFCSEDSGRPSSGVILHQEVSWSSPALRVMHLAGKGGRLR